MKCEPACFCHWAKLFLSFETLLLNKIFETLTLQGLSHFQDGHGVLNLRIYTVLIPANSFTTSIGPGDMIHSLAGIRTRYFLRYGYPLELKNWFWCGTFWKVQSFSKELSSQCTSNFNIKVAQVSCLGKNRHIIQVWYGSKIK